ncbi:UMP kinase [Candidatus Pyrohabitans sp.]
MKAVLSLGGSIVASPGINLDFIEGFASLIARLHREGHRLAVVVGGGRVAREYITAARSLGAGESFCDELGILATRMNARLVIAALGDLAYPHVPERVEEVEEWDRIIVMGGTVPGHTTDAVAAMLGAKLGAELLVNATNVDGVYSEDPKKNPGARKYERISVEELLRIVGREHRAGASAVLDPKAVRIIGEHRLRTIVVKGELSRIEAALRGGEHHGTVVEV